jgi:hypothetical protein
MIRQRQAVRTKLVMAGCLAFDLAADLQGGEHDDQAGFDRGPARAAVGDNTYESQLPSAADKFPAPFLPAPSTVEASRACPLTEQQRSVEGSWWPRTAEPRAGHRPAKDL